MDQSNGMTDINQNQTICYWPDGYWITDPEEAEVLDSVNAFGAEHQQMEVGPDVDVQAVVNAELMECCNRLSQQVAEEVSGL